MQDPDRLRPSELRALAFWLWLGCIVVKACAITATYAWFRAQDSHSLVE